MAATILVSCPQCKKKLNLPETLKGKKIRCKDCGTVFPVQEAAKPAAAAKAAKKQNDEEDSSPYAFMSDDAPPQGSVPPPPPPKPPPSPAGRRKGDEEDANPYGVTELELTPRCPFCAKELESADSIVCLHCGYNNQTRKKADTKRVYDITPGDRIWWWLPGVINLFLIFFLIGLDIYFVFGLEPTWKWLDNELLDEGNRTLSTGIRLWFVCGSIYAMYKCGQTVVRRFITQPTPPEEEKR